ncbi:MAG: hypothetical protein JXP34_08500 [Planctomycetes bacterium]|nr:hypothetical protein [Planctomycetota bacterium]
MEVYDPMTAPDPADWLDLDEQLRIALIREQHERAKVPLREARLEIHAIIHSVVENQLAMGDPSETRLALERLRGEGLDRHDAIHAIGSILLDHMSTLMMARPDELSEDVNEPYRRALEALDAESWRQSG